MDVGYIVTVIGVILVSMTVHELMHGLVAYYLGDDTAKLQGRLTLNPVKHIDPFLTIILPVLLAVSGAPIFGGAKPVPFNPSRLRYEEWGVALVAFSGPLVNLVLAFVSYGIVVLTGESQAVLSQIFSVSTIVNLGFFVFNMLPIPPLDGSRVIYALAPDFVRRGMEAIEQFGIVFIFVLVLLGSSILGGVMSAVIGTILQLFRLIYGVA